MVAWSLPIRMNYDNRIREREVTRQPLLDLDLPRTVQPGGKQFPQWLEQRKQLRRHDVTLAQVNDTMAFFRTESELQLFSGPCRSHSNATPRRGR